MSIIYGQPAARIGPDCMYMPDLTSRTPIRFRFLQRRPGLYCAKSAPGPIWMAWSGCPEASRCARIIGPGSGRTQPARYQFPTFRLGCVLPQTAWVILCYPPPPPPPPKKNRKKKHSQDPVWFRLTVSGFDRTDPVRKQAGVQESSGPLLANASEPTRMILTGMHAVGSGQSVVGSG